MSNKHSILVVEDDPAVAKGLIYGLREEGFKTYHASSVGETISTLPRQKIHLALLDVRLPDGNGFDLCRKLRSEGYTIPIIMVTARDEEVDKVLGLEIGADDYIVKPFSFLELLSRIRAQLRRAFGDLSRNEKRIFRFGEIEIHFEELRAWREEREIFLTPTEFRLLKYLSQNEGRPLTREQLIQEVWGSTIYIEDERTVDVHIRHLREKIETDASEPQFIKTVRGFGYKFDPEGFDETGYIKKS